MKTMLEIIETGLKNKYTFNFKNGKTQSFLNIQELYDFDPNDLDIVYKCLVKQKRELEGESLLTTVSPAETVIDNKIMIIKHIVEKKISDAKIAEERALVSQQNYEEFELLTQVELDKRMEKYRNMTEDEIVARKRELISK